MSHNVRKRSVRHVHPVKILIITARDAYWIGKDAKFVQSDKKDTAFPGSGTLLRDHF